MDDLVDDDEFRVLFDREFVNGTRGRDWDLAAFDWLQPCCSRTKSARLLAPK